ncbi:MAG: hypothetical protein Kow0062_00340 [Acidobacteriota bacterium]
MRFTRLAALLPAALLATAVASAAPPAAPPDAEYNPVTGKIETVDQVPGAEIRHTIDGGPGQPDSSVLLTSDPAPDLAPRIAIGPDGSSWVVWWRDGGTGTVLLRRRTVEGSWTSELPISEPDESSSEPEIAHDGRRVFVVWIIDDGEGYDIAVRSGNGPTPWPTRNIIHRTWYRGPVDPDVHASDGNVWVTWTESATELGWSEFDYATESWSAPRFEPLDESGRQGALSRIAEQVSAD